MIFRCPLCILILFICVATHAQDTIPFSQLLNHKDSIEILYKKYLNTKGDPEKKIDELIELAQEDPDRLNSLRKFQIALLLEKQILYPTETILRLNLSIGDLISYINKGYALEFFRKATLIAEKIAPERLFHLYTNLAGSLQHLTQFDSARIYYYKAILPGRLDNPISEASAYNNLGLFFSAINSPDS